MLVPLQGAAVRVVCALWSGHAVLVKHLQVERCLALGFADAVHEVGGCPACCSEVRRGAVNIYSFTSSTYWLVGGGGRTNLELHLT